MPIQIPYNFTPRNYQVPTYDALPNGFKRGFDVWHRRAGKDKTFINVMAREMVKRAGTYFYILPYYKQARMIIWEGTDSQGFNFIDHIPQQIVTRKENQQMILETQARDGGTSKLRMLGSDNINAIVGTNPVGVIFSEFPLHKPSAWHYLRPILLENKGWALFNGTPRGRNHAHKLWMDANKSDEWHTQLLTIDDTYNEDGKHIITAEDIQRERELGMPEELIEQEFYCSWDAGLVGNYYADLIKMAIEENRVGNYPYEPDLPVISAWDLGLNDTNTIWFFQVVGREVRVIRVYSNRGKPLPHYLNYCNDTGYTFSEHIFPHDIAVREYTTGVQRLQTLYNLGFKNITVAPKLALQEGINIVRQFLPRCYFNEETVFEGLEALKTYRREYDEKNDTFRNIPVHDWSSHFADSFRIGATCLNVKRVGVDNITKYNVGIGHNHNPLTPVTEAQILMMEQYTDPLNYDPITRNVINY